MLLWYGDVLLFWCVVDNFIDNVECYVGVVELLVVMVGDGV